MSFVAYKEDGSKLFETQYISYGLIRSGYMQYIKSLPTYILRSAQLDPTDESNYRETPDVDPVYGFSVAGAVAPLVFIEGTGKYVGASYDNGVTTFMYMYASANTKFFYFDTMRNFPIGAGIKTFRDTPGNELSFNSAMVPLDIDHSVFFPPVPPQVHPSLPRFVYVPFEGGSLSWTRPVEGGSYNAYITVKRFWPLGPYRYAAMPTFSRAFGNGRMDSMDIPMDPNVSQRGTSFIASGASSDGAYGMEGGIMFLAIDAFRRSYIPVNNFGPMSYWDVPRDRLPQVLVIRSDILPFPYSVG